MTLSGKTMDSFLLTVGQMSARQVGALAPSISDIPGLPPIQDIRRVRLLLAQAWLTFDESTKRELYEQAKAAQRDFQKPPSLWKLLKNAHRTGPAVMQMFKRSGLEQSMDVLMEYKQEFNAFLRDLIAAWERDQGGTMEIPGATPDERAALVAVNQLSSLGLRNIVVERSSEGGLNLKCLVTPEVEYEYEPSQQIGVALMSAVNAAGGWVDEIDFIPVHA